jgi:TPR repeat protein
MPQEPKPYTVPAEDPRLLAALSGHPDAQYDLGVAYARGLDVQSDYTVPPAWLI